MTRPAYFLLLLAAIFAGPVPVKAESIENPVAVFSGLDKITATIVKFEIPVNSTKQFGSLRVTPRVCYTKPQTETPETTSFVEINEVQLDGKVQKVFSGWMFASSPGLNALEHAVYDVWLTNCRTSSAAVSVPNE